MSRIRVECHPNFKGNDVVLLALDADGLLVFAAALGDARQAIGSIVRVATETSTNLIVVGGRDARLDFQQGRVTWRLSGSKATEILNKLESMQGASRPVHHYVGIDGPYDTLVLSRDEYLQVATARSTPPASGRL